MLDHRLRRVPNIKSTLAERLVGYFAVNVQVHLLSTGSEDNITV